MADSKKRPWLKFYPQDWRGDAKLRACSIGARGLWIEMISIMHEAEPYGHLMLGEIAVTNRQLAALAGISARDCLTFIAELGSAGVFSRDDQGRMFSRRMVRDHERATKGKSDAEKRWGNGHPNADPNGVGNGEPITPYSRDQIDRIGSAQAREPAGFTEGSKALADAFWRGLGFASKLEITPEFSGVDWRAIGWESAGWSCEMVEAQARLTGRDKPLTYHEKVFATAHARLRAPLPKVEIREAETLRVNHAPNRSSGSVTAAFREIREQMQSGHGDEAGGNAVLRLSSR